MYPADRRYTKEHEWVRVEGDRATIGITDYAQKQLGDVVYLELPEVGRKLEAHASFGTVESYGCIAPVCGVRIPNGPTERISVPTAPTREAALAPLPRYATVWP